MKYDIHYDRSKPEDWQRAYDDAVNYHSGIEPILFYAIIHGASMKTVKYAATFGGVQGFPVEAMYRQLRSEVSQTS